MNNKGAIDPKTFKHETVEIPEQFVPLLPRGKDGRYWKLVEIDGENITKKYPEEVKKQLDALLKECLQTSEAARSTLITIYKKHFSF